MNTKIIIKPRACGKTHNIVKRSSKDGGIIICSDRQEVNYIKDLAHYHQMTIPEPFTIKQVNDGKTLGLSTRSYHVDNVDRVLCSLLGYRGPINTISINGPDIRHRVKGAIKDINASDKENAIEKLTSILDDL